MSIAKTLAEVARAVLYESAVVTGTGTQKRHPIEDLYPEINSAFVEQQELSVVQKVAFYTVESDLAPLPTDRASPGENYSLIDWPAATHDIARVDVLLTCGDWKKLDPVDWENLREVIPSKRTQTVREPTHFSARQFGSSSGATVSAGKIAIAPFCTAGQYKLSTLPVWTPITDTAHVFLFPSESAFRWTVWNVVARIAARDTTGKMKMRYDISVRERSVLEARTARATPTPSGSTMRRARNRWS